MLGEKKIGLKKEEIHKKIGKSDNSDLKKSDQIGSVCFRGAKSQVFQELGNPICIRFDQIGCESDCKSEQSDLILSSDEFQGGKISSFSGIGKSDLHPI